MKESKIIELLRKGFGKNEVIKFSANMKNRIGILDCEIAYDGLSFWVEIKIGKDTLKPMQKKFIERHLECSFIIYYKNNEFMVEHSNNEYLNNIAEKILSYLI